MMGNMLLLDGPPQMVSVGYEGQTNAQLIDHLLAASVTCVVDVRLNPISRKPGLSKTKLSESLAKAGIEYVHLRALGNPKNNREAFRQGENLARRRFEEHIENIDAQVALDLIGKKARTMTVALLCFEREHAACHRHIVAEAVMRRLPQLELRVVPVASISD